MRKLTLTYVAGLIGLLSLASPAMADDAAPPTADESASLEAIHDCLWAQVPDDGRPPRRGQGMHRRVGERMEQMKHLEQLRMLKMLELLDLSEDQEIAFLTTFNAMRKKQRELGETSQLVTDSLARELRNGSASEARINDLVDRAQALLQDRHQMMMDFIDQSRTLLTAEQVGRLVVFQKRFESELLERVGRYRKGAGPDSPELPEDDG